MGRNFSKTLDIDGSLEVRFRCSNEQLSEFIVKKMDSDLKAFTSKYGQHFTSMNVDLDVRKMRAKIRGIPEYECRINFITDKGSYHATSSGIGAVNAMNDCLSSLEIQIIRKKAKFENKNPTRSQDPYMVSEFEEA